MLDLAAVLYTHSALSPEYRLHATMCYWFAGSTYDIMQALFDGVSHPTKDSHRAGKLKLGNHSLSALIKRSPAETGDEAIRTTMRKEIEQYLEDKAMSLDPGSDVGSIVQAEMANIPKFEDLRTTSLLHRDRVRDMLEQRERDRLNEAARIGAEWAAAVAVAKAKAKAEMEKERDAAIAAAVSDKERMAMEIEALKQQIAEDRVRMEKKLAALVQNGAGGASLSQ